MSAKVEAAVTERLISIMDKGTCPWDYPFVRGLAVPTSFATGKAYRGINTIILKAVQMDEGYEHPLWITRRQVEEQGGTINRNADDEEERYTPVVLWKDIKKKKADGTEEKIFFMRFFQVWNIAQTSIEVPAKFIYSNEPISESEGLKKVLYYKGAPAVEHVLSDACYYSPSKDKITLPLLKQFLTETGLTGAAMHEAVHGTGSEKRLNRLDKDAKFGSDPYAKEELVAEIGAALLALLLGMDVDWNRSAAYVESWLNVLRGDRKLLIHASQAAQKAADYILGTTFSDSEKKEAK